MEILCCFKIVPELDKVLTADWREVQPSGPNLSYVPQVIGCYDEAGLETALRIRDGAEAVGETVNITCVTLGGGDYGYFFRGLFALGVGRIVQIRPQRNLTFSPLAVADAVCDIFSDSRFDAVICGVQSSDGNNGLTPYLIAKGMGMPCIPNVTEIRFEPSGLRVSREVRGGSRTVKIAAPAVYAVGNSVNPFLRMPTVKKRMAAAETPFETVELPAGSESPTTIVTLVPKAAGESCAFVPGDSAAEIAGNLLKLCPEVRPT